MVVVLIVENSKKIQKRKQLETVPRRVPADSTFPVTVPLQYNRFLVFAEKNERHRFVRSGGMGGACYSPCPNREEVGGNRGLLIVRKQQKAVAYSSSSTSSITRVRRMWGTKKKKINKQVNP